jgi:hypothetical protein
MPNGKKDTMAQAVYLAQLEANRGTCKCKVCRILRKGSEEAADAFLAAKSPAPVVDPALVAGLTPPGAEED